MAGLAQAGPYDTWGKYKTLTINTTNTSNGANVSGTVANFPVLVRLTTSTADDILGDALANGADVRFASSDGSTALSYQIERWTSTAADIWVLVPSVAGNSTTDIRVYWLKSGQSTASSASSVFATSNGFVGVWHLAETGSNTAGNYKDATGTYDNTTAAGMTAAGAGQVTGIIGNATAFDGSSSYLGFGTTAGSAASQTVSFWMKSDNAGAYQSVVDKIPNDASGVGWTFKARNDGSMWYRVGSETATSDFTKGSAYSTGNWVLVTGTFSGGTQNFYINGTAAGSAMTGVTRTVNNSTTTLRFGSPSAAVTTERLDGALDEVQISSSVRNSDWVKLSYETQKSSATCISFGPTVPLAYYWNRNAVLTSSTDPGKAYNWSTNADGTGRMAVSSMDDDFTADALSGWTFRDADNDAGTGSNSLTSNADQLTLSGRGSDVYLTANQYVAVYRSDITGDFDVSVKVVSQTAADIWSKTGIAMADDFTNLGSGGFAAVAVTPSNGFTFQYDGSGTVGEMETESHTGSSPSSSFPCWLRLVKSGTSVSGYYKTSTSGTWTQIGSTVTPQSTASNSQIALLSTAHTTSVTCTAVLDEFQGGSTLSSGLDLSFNGSGSNKNANATLSGSLTAASIDFTNYTGTFNFGSGTLSINSGNAVFGNGMAITPGTGTLAFTGSSGTQVLTPPSGISLPAVSSTGAATLQLSTNTLYCKSYTQSAGTLDFNGEDVTTTGDFTLTSGTAASFSNLTGRTLTVGGDASFTGSAGNLVNLDQGAWTMTAAGALTADYARIYGSNASGGSKGVATHSYNAKSNTNWLFSVPATLSNLTRSVRLNFNTTAAGVTGNVANFPLLVRFTSSNLTFSATSDSGSDLIFVDKDGSTLYHQVVEWDKPNQTGKVWVRVPQVDGNSTTDYITLYYGCDSCTTNSYARSDSVFTVFKGVFHLSAPEAKAYDATTLANHGAYISNLPNLANGGIVSKNAAVFDGAANSYIDVPNESNYDLTTNISVWAWIKVSSFNSAYQAILTKGNNTFRLTRHNTTNFLYWACTKSSSTFQLGGSVNVNDGNWHLAVGTYAGDSLRLYVDGVRDGAATALTGSIDANNTDVYIGENAGNSGTVWNGSLSEARIGNTSTALSPDFIKLSYETQKANSTFLTSYTTASFQSSKVFKLNTTASGANVTGDVTNFPLLIRLTGVSAMGVTGSGTSIPTDIRFMDYDGTWLDYQVERWDRTGGVDSAEVWVKVPTIEGNYAGHTITMYYKQAASVSVVDGQCAACVFNSSNGFVAAWHLGDTTGTAARPNAVNAGTNDAAPKYNGAALSLTPIRGVIGKADTLRGNGTGAGTVGDHFDLGTLAAGTFPSGKATLSMWAKPTAFGSNNFVHFFSVGNTTGSSGNNEIWFGRRGATDSSLDGQVMAGLSNTNSFFGSAGTINTGSWQLFTLTVNGTNDTLYRNGAYVASTASGNSLRDTVRSMNYAGRSDWTADSTLKAAVDEARISNVTRSASWVKLEYQNQRRDAAPLFNPSPADFQSTQKYTFNTTRTGANVSGDVTDFPLLVRITGSSITDAVEGTGVTVPPDIRFLDADGKTWLNYVVERWTRTTDSAEVWVQVPQVDGNSDHDYITMYYNSVTTGAIADGQCGSCVFGSANGFTGTWHMDDSAASATVTEVVASQNGTFKNLTTNENTSANNHTSAGIIGRSLDFQGSGGGTPSGTQANNFTHTLQWPKTTGTISHWVKPDQVRTMMTVYESNGTTATTYNGLGINGTNVLECNLGINGTSYAFTYQDGTDGNTLNLSGGSPASGTWAHVAATWNRSGNAIVYVNGVQVASADMSGVSLNSTTPTVMQVGRVGDSTAARNWDGSIDEIQVANVERSADWMKLAYETQRRTGNAFWNSRSGPNNTAVLTATATSASNISLSWPSSVSDSSNADSVGIWMKYAAYPDSVGTGGGTLVAKLAKTDTTWSYPATYPTTYWFALAVRNTSGQWSPFTSSSSDSATLVGLGVTMPDTVYVDSAIGSNSNSCSAAQNPSTPKLTIAGALACGASASDTLVVRVMPGTYTDSAFSITSKPSIVTSFDNNSRAIMYGAGSGTVDGGARVWTLLLYGNMGIRNLDIKCKINGYSGVYVTGADNIYVEGCRIYNGPSAVHGAGIEVVGGFNQHHFANNLIYQPTYHGFKTTDDNSFNFVNNTLVGPGGSGTGFWMNNNAFAADMTVSNNIFYNWDYGIISNSANIGSCASNLFFGVTSGREVTTTTCTGSVTRDPLFANTTPTSRLAFKLLPGSPAIDAGSSTYGSGAQAVTRRTPADFFGTARPVGSAPDIGLYEGTGYTPNPTGEFDTLTVSSTSSTVTVQNSKWKLIWDQARGAGITEFYDKTTAPSTNLVASSSLLFDAKIDSYQASLQTAAGPTVSLMESSRGRAVIRQRLAVSASIDLNIFYAVYPSGHVYIESELSNLAAATTTVGTVDYTLKLGPSSTAYTSAGTNRGFGYLQTSTRDAALIVNRDLDGGASGTETWSTSTATSGASGNVVFKTTDLADLSRNTVRRHDFLLYLGSNSLTFENAATLNADAYGPSPLSLSAGTLMGERSWQEGLQGHWNLDDGAGATARDKAVFVQNNATLAGSGYRWVSGKVNGGLYLTTTDSAYVASASVHNAANGFTVMFWLKPDFTGMGDTALIVSKGLGNASGWYCRKVANASGTNKIMFNMGGTTVTSTSLTDLAWSHIAIVAEAAGNRNLQMFVNGVQVAASTAAAVVNSNTLNLLLGYASGSVAAAKFKGTLDDVRIYSRDVQGSDIQSIYNRGFNSRYGQYSLRADNNNRIVALINQDTAKTRMQPAFFISNWYGPRTPKYVFLNGARLTPNVDFVSDSLYGATFGNYLVFQLNKVLTDANQTLFIDDDDSTGFMGSAAAMKSLTISATSSKLTIKNFADTVFGSAASGQWYMELGLKGWTTPTGTLSIAPDSGFGEIMRWKAAAVSPNVAISSAYQLTGYSYKSGRTLSSMKLDATAPETFTSGLGYLSPATNTYTLVDSSSTRLSLTLSADSLTGEGTAAVTKRFTFYPTGRVFVSYQVRNQSINFDTPRLDLSAGYDAGNATASWSTTTATNNARWAWIGGDLNFHPIGMALLSIKNATSTYKTAASMVNSTTTNIQTGSSEQSLMNFNLQTSLWTSANKPVTVNFMMDFSKRFQDSATADSLLKDSQNPALLTAITGTRVNNDALDPDTNNFAEGDGAYTYAASSGIAHFKFVNTVTSFFPAFRISSWTQGVLPEFVMLDNQVLTRGYQYNSYLNTASNEVVMQFNKTLTPGTHVFFISHKSGLAVKLNRFVATGGEGADSLSWTTESEFENLGFHLWRREVPADSAAAKNAARLRDSVLAEHGLAKTNGGTTTGDALKTAAGDSAAAPDTLPSLALSPQELILLGYVRITPKLIPGAPGGSSAITREYLHVDRSASFGKAYEYLLEAIDFNDGHVFYGPRAASPGNPYNTEILPNYPNPFNPITTLRFSLREKLKVSLVIYDARGRVVRTLVRPDKPMAAGKYNLIWDARNDLGMEAPSGQYFYRFTAGRYVKARKMILLK